MSGRLLIPVLHGGSADRPDEADTVIAAEAIAAALGRLGHDSRIVALGLDLTPIAALATENPAAIFNLVEALAGDGRLAPMAAALMDRIGIRYSGAGAPALFATLSKPAMKLRLRAAALPTPTDWTPDRPDDALYIVKAADEHASLGMDAGSVVRGAEVAAALSARQRRHGVDFFAERFIAGREFNVSILQRGRHPVVLPIAEIDFAGLPADHPHIVDYAAKWDEASAAARGTIRRFGLERDEPELADRLSALARDVWHLFGLAGYARIDFRVDGGGNPFILEANANPCLAPDAGFAAAAAEAGIGYDETIAAILAAALGTSREARTDAAGIRFGDDVGSADIDSVRTLVAKTGMFSPEETAIAAELVEERLARGEQASGYRFLMARCDGGLAGYACFGPTPGTDRRHDLYWIAVDPDFQGLGIGGRLLARVEALLRAEGGERIYAETSSTPRYAATRAFYLAAGFEEAARIDGFYRVGDSKVIYEKRL